MDIDDAIGVIKAIKIGPPLSALHLEVGTVRVPRTSPNSLIVDIWARALNRDIDPKWLRIYTGVKLKSIDKLQTPKQLCNVFAQVVTARFLFHEMQESLLFDNRRILDPHALGAAIARKRAYAQQRKDRRALQP